MQLEALMAFQPILHLLGLVRRVVVDNEMQIELLIYAVVDLVQEPDEFLGAVARQALHRSRCRSSRIESGKQGCRAVALVIMRHRLARPFFIGRPGCVRSSACIWLFSSTHSTQGLVGGFM